MKFHFENIRAVKDAHLELGGLTIVAGRNNTGKTYLAYTVYGFLKRWRYWPELVSGELPVLLKRLYDGSRDAERLNLSRLVRSLLEKGEARQSVDRKTLAQHRSHVVESIAHHFSLSGLPEVFSSPPSEFDGARLSVDFGKRFPAAVEPRDSFLPGGNRLSVAYDDNHVVFRGDFVRGSNSPTEQYLRHFLPVAYVDLLMSELPDPFILSAERFGISLFYKELDFTKNKLVDLLQQLKNDEESRRMSPYLLIDRTTSRYALPIKDNIDFTRNVSDIRRGDSELTTMKLFNAIREMMDGYYQATDDEIRFISKRRGERRFNIPLHLASSSARGLSDFYFFLRHVARRNHLLIVDEPESHLDTQNQILLARMLSRLVSTGIRVLVTTHSDYLVKELNNLLMLNALPKDADVVRSMGYSDEQPLEPDNVRAYIASGGSLSRCTVDRYGIDMPVFDKTIDSINRVSMSFSSRLAIRG